MAVEGFRKIIDANLTSTFMLSQAAYPEMKRAGGGKIINIGSMASYIGGAALDRLWTGQVRHSSAQQELRVGVGEGQHPGQYDLAGLHRHGHDQAHAGHDGAARTSHRPYRGRPVGTPDDFAGIAAFLASSASDFVTGADIAVDGGMMWGV